MERRSLAHMSALMALSGLNLAGSARAQTIGGEDLMLVYDDDDHPVPAKIAEERYFMGEYGHGRRPRIGGGKSYAIVADPARAKVKAARKQSKKNRKKK